MTALAPLPTTMAPLVRVDWPVPPLPTATTPVKLMSGVAPPDDASGADAVTPVTVPPVELIVIEPAPFVMLMPVPAVSTAGVKLVPLPIGIWPFAGAAESRPSEPTLSSADPTVVGSGSSH